MVTAGLFSHDSPDGRDFEDRILAAGYRSLGAGWTVGENIAWGTGSLATPRAITAAWMNSPGHRANVLEPDYREIGIGVALGTPGAGADGATYTSDFGARDSAVVRAQRHRAARKRTRKRARRHARRRTHRAHHRRHR
jgi:uncharacterized protein YkwD